MSALNQTRKSTPIYTAEGGRAVRTNASNQLRRSVMACMLWEDNFYEDGQSIAERIKSEVHATTLETAANIAIEAREKMHLRHVPLLVVREMARHPALSKSPQIVKETLARVIQRPDELSEFLALYWKDGKSPLSGQVKKGLAKAFTKFNEYSLAKYNRKKDIMLRDVLMLCHAKPADVTPDMAKWNKDARAGYKAVDHHTDQALWYTHEFRPDGFTPGELLQGKLMYDQLATPDTWEVQLSAGANKRETFERLMNDNNLGDLAFLRNLRNMTEAGVSLSTIVGYGNSRKWGRVLPFRFIAAAHVVPQLEPHLERWMMACLTDAPKLKGKTVLLCDVSSSMGAKLSGKSDLTRDDAMKGLAMLLREVCEEVEIVPFANNPVSNLPPRRGFALADILNRNGTSDGTNIGLAVNYANTRGADRIICITDEQSHDNVGKPNVEHAYMLNVANNKNGVGYGAWTKIDGFSEAVVDYILESEET